MIRVENVTKTFGRHVLFDRIGFALGAKERLGLVGRNGEGKTTLLRLISGEIQPDTGTIFRPKNYRIAYLRQHLEFSKDTVRKEAMTALSEQQRDQHWRVERVLCGLGFSPGEFNRHPREFSGGFQVRLNLVKALVAEPDLLLLDEPTNFLDITSIRWVAHFLSTWPHELILVTHDRGFMDRLVTHTLGIHRRKVRKIAGDTGKYYSQIARDEEVYEKTRINDERRRKEIEQFIKRFRAKARLANLVQSRIKALQKKEKKEKLAQPALLDFSFRPSAFPAKHVLSASDVDFSYSSHKPLIKGFNITITAGQRICIVGRNGQGKSTLLKILAGKLNAQNGEVVFHPAVKRGFFEQTNIQSLANNRTVLEEIIYAGPDVDLQKARNICGAMMFSGDDALKKIGVLSGGEKSRVLLARLLATPVNLLLLDEPTNHLDMESCDALLAALDSFAGTVLIVTHNEMFLHALADRLIVFEGNAIEIFEGSYGRFLEKGGWREEIVPLASKPGQETALPGPEKLTKKELRRRRSAIIARRSKVLKPLQERIAHLEKVIETVEKKLEQLTAAMQHASQKGDGQHIAELSRAIHGHQRQIDRDFDALEQATATLDARRAVFAAQLNHLEEATGISTGSQNESHSS